MFRGTFTALVTPFRDGEIDIAGAGAIDRERRSRRVLPAWSPSARPANHRPFRMKNANMSSCSPSKIAKGRCQVLAGTGSYSTRDAIEATQRARRLGADGSARSSRRITTSLARKVCSGIFRRSPRPRRCRSALQYSGPLLRRYCGGHGRAIGARLQNIVSIKEASGSVDRVSELRGRLPERVYNFERGRFAYPAFHGGWCRWRRQCRFQSCPCRNLCARPRLRNWRSEIRAQTSRAAAAAFQKSLH